MAREVFLDTSGFFSLLDSADLKHHEAVAWMDSQKARVRPISTECVVGETCTLLVARKRPHLVKRFLDSLDRSTALLLINPDHALVQSAKLLIRRQADQGYSFVDCLSFCLMKERGIREALTTDQHFRKAGYTPLLA